MNVRWPVDAKICTGDAHEERKKDGNGEYIQFHASALLNSGNTC